MTNEIVCEDEQSMNKLVTNDKNASFTYDYDCTKNSDFEVLDWGDYKKIYDYDIFQKYKGLMNINLDISKDEFEDNILVIVVSPNKFGLKYYQSRIIKNVLHIEVTQNNDIRLKDNGIAILLPKNIFDNKEVQINIVIPDFIFNSHKSLLDENYTKQDIIDSNVFLVNCTNKKSNNKNILEEFINKVDSNETCEIRVVTLRENSDDFYVDDIKYISNDKFYIRKFYCNDFELTDLHYNYTEINKKKVEIKKYSNNKNSLYQDLVLCELNDSNNEFSFFYYK